MDVLGHILRRRVEHIERRELVEPLVVQAVENGVDHALHFHKIHQQPDGIQLVALQGDLAAVIVAVHVLALPVIVSQGVAGGECLFDRHFKH